MKNHFELFVYKWIPEKDDHKVIKVCNKLTIKECIQMAKEFAKLDPWKIFTFKWESFEQIAHNFSIVEYREEIIDGLPIMMHFASMNLEQVLHDKVGNLESYQNG